MSSHHLELDASEVNVPVNNAGDVSLIEEDEVPLSSVAFARALSDSQWKPDASPVCGLSLPRPL